MWVKSKGFHVKFHYVIDRVFYCGNNKLQYTLCGVDPLPYTTRDLLKKPLIKDRCKKCNKKRV